MNMKRRWWWSSWLAPDYDPRIEEDRREVASESEANLVGSVVVGEPGSDASFHMPVIDIDFPCKVVESETPGHFHLYIDVAVDWWAYKDLLAALAEAGIVQPGYVKASIERGQTFVATKPWKKAT